MGAWLDTLNAFTVTLRNLGRPRVTEKLPWKGERPHPERHRANFALVDDEQGEIACIGCKACENVCPSGIISIQVERRDSPITGKKRGYPSAFVLDLNACLFCELCVQVCPNDAIVPLTKYRIAGYTRSDQVLTLDRLRENAKSDRRAWTTGSRLREMQDPERKARAAGAPEGGKE